MTTWKLPHGISDLSIANSNKLVKIRQQLLDLYRSFGYQFVYPPIVEYEGSLFALKEDTSKSFKTIDPYDSKLLIIHSDITPQIARLDAKYNKDKDNDIARYCYISSILKTVSDDFYSTRNPIQVGAEIYGSNSYKADLEIINLTLKSIILLGFDNKLLLNIGNVEIFNILVKRLKLTQEELQSVINIFKKKSTTDLIKFFKTCKNKNNNIDDLIYLLSLDGDVSVLKSAKKYYQHIPSILSIIDNLNAIYNALESKNINIYFDLSELKAHSYYTGLIFSCFYKQFPKALAQGGRYNNLANRFLVSRPATGFSIDLKYLISNDKQKIKNNILYAPYELDDKLAELINTLRAKGNIIINDINNKQSNSFININNEWQIKPSLENKKD